MSLTQTQTPETAGPLTAQAHHLKAAEHLDLASKTHKDVAKLIDCGDHKSASSQAKIAGEHAETAAKHVIEAAKSAATAPTAKK